MATKRFRRNKRKSRKSRRGGDNKDVLKSKLGKYFHCFTINEIMNVPISITRKKYNFDMKTVCHLIRGEEYVPGYLIKKFLSVRNGDAFLKSKMEFFFKLDISVDHEEKFLVLYPTDLICIYKNEPVTGNDVSTDGTIDGIIEKIGVTRGIKTEMEYHKGPVYNISEYEKKEFIKGKQGVHERLGYNELTEGGNTDVTNYLPTTKPPKSSWWK